LDKNPTAEKEDYEEELKELEKYKIIVILESATPSLAEFMDLQVDRNLSQMMTLMTQIYEKYRVVFVFSNNKLTCLICSVYCLFYFMRTSKTMPRGMSNRK